MKRFLLGLVLMLVTVGVCQAQTLTTVIGTVNDSTGNLATSGTVTFTLAPNSNSILYYVSGLDVIAPVAGSCGINGSGQIKNLALSGVCQVWGNDVISPANTTYTVQFLPNGTPGMLIRQLLITGTTYSLSSPVFTPQVQINPQYTTIYAAPLQSNLMPAAPDVFNIGASGMRFASGYFDNLFVTNSFSVLNLTVPGTLHVVDATMLDSTLGVGGLATFNAGITGTGDTGTLTPGSGMTTSIYSNPHTWSALQTFGAGITGTGNTGGLLPGTGILNTANTWGAIQTVESLLPVSSAANLGSTTKPWIATFVGATPGNYTEVSSNSSGGHIATYLSGTGLISFFQLGDCGSTSGGTQACAGSPTVSPVVNPIAVRGDVLLNTAATQSITSLPFTGAADYSCSGSDLTNAAGIVSFNTYAAASVTIQESGGGTTDHLRYFCMGF